MGGPRRLWRPRAVGGQQLRSLGDGLSELEAVRWLSPFGLLSLSHPYADDNVMPLFLLLLGCAGGVVGTAAAARRRDLRGAVIGGSAGRRPRTALLGSMTRFAVRRLWRIGRGWAVGVAAYFALVGAATAAWTGASAAGASVALAGAAAGTANVLPVVLLSLGAAVLALGWTPRAVVAVGSRPA